MVLLISGSPCNNIITILGSIAEHALHSKFVPVLVEWSVWNAFASMLFKFQFCIIMLHYEQSKFIILLFGEPAAIFPHSFQAVLGSRIFCDQLTNIIIKIICGFFSSCYSCFALCNILFGCISLLSSFLMPLGLNLIDNEDLTTYLR